jgi:hypothetical protein
MAVSIPCLGSPVDFYQRHFANEWWISSIQSYAQLRITLEGEGLHQHHLISKSLFLHGPIPTRGIIDYVPSVTLSQAEHLRTLHTSLNRFLEGKSLWQRSLSSRELSEAIDFTADFYQRRGLRHFAAAIRGFRREAYDKVA